MAASRSCCFCTRSSSSGTSGVAARAAAGGAPRLDQRQRPAGQQLTSCHRSVIHSPFRLLQGGGGGGPSYMKCDSAQTLCDLQATKTSSTKSVQSTATSSPSVTGSVATQLYKQQADLLPTEACRVFSRLAAAAPTPAVLESISRHFPAGSLQRSYDPWSGRARPSASARASPSGLSCISGWGPRRLCRRGGPRTLTLTACISSSSEPWWPSSRRWWKVLARP